MRVAVTWLENFAFSFKIGLSKNLRLSYAISNVHNKAISSVNVTTTTADRRFMLHYKQLCADHRPKFRRRVVSFYSASFFYRGIGCLPLAAD